MKNESTAEQIANFWSYAPQGLTMRELLHMTPEMKAARAAQPAGELAVAVSVQMEQLVITPNQLAA